MAGSQRSPVLRDQWSADPDRDPRDRDRRRGRGSHRDQGRNRYRGRGHHRQNNRGFDNTNRSPPTRVSRFRPDSSHGPADFSLNRSPQRGSPGHSPGFPEKHRPSRPRVSSPNDWSAPSHFDKEDRGFHRDESPFAPPSKRKRTRSPSPRRPASRGSFPHRRPSFNKSGDRRDRSPSYKTRGRFPGRGGPRRGSPRRGRDHRGRDRGRANFSKRGRSRSPVRGRSRSPAGDDYSDRGSRYRSRSASRLSAASNASPHSSYSRDNDAMNLTRPIRSVVDEPGRSVSPPRPIPTFDGESMGRFGDGHNRSSEEFPLRGRRPSGGHKSHRRSSRPHPDTGPYSRSPQLSPTNSHHGSPGPTSPFSGGRGGWSQHPSYPGPAPTSPFHSQEQYHSQNAPSGQYSGNSHSTFNGPPQHIHSSYDGPPYQGNHSGYRGHHANQGLDRRFSGSGPPFNNGPSDRGGRSHFNRTQWTASGSRGRGGRNSPQPSHIQRSQTPSTRPPSAIDPESPRRSEYGIHPQPAVRDMPRDDDWNQPFGDMMSEPQNAPPAGRGSDVSTAAEKGEKFSFTLKPKTTPTPAPKPVPDFSQRMQPREPPPRVPDPPTPRNRLTNGPMPTFKPEPRFDRRDRNRGRDRDFDRDRRDFRDSRNFREPQDRRDDRRGDNRRDRRRGDRRPDFRPDRRREPPSPEVQKDPSPKPKHIALRFKPRPMLSDEYAKADSVYYRKPGNESVIGAGTYGKVFKGVHVYTKGQVALKKIRMEGEKDGFPFTATREIKLLQYLRHQNVVSLLEVMVERNECFMVFEYLSHDLTGLINHPNFTLTLAHKKNLAHQMFEGLNYLHHRGVLHRDIKAANILISNRGLLKFADFGLARFYKKHRQDEYTNRVITIWYRPPELLLGETRYGPAVDVWSAACVCMEMFTKKAVFPGEGGEISQLEKLFNALGTPTRADWADFVEMPWFQLMRPAERKKRVFEDMYRETLSPEAMNLISSIFQYDPAKRPSAEEVLKHAYFASEGPTPQQAIELEEMKGDWHEFESKALRKEARRAEQQSQKDREKRKAEASMSNSSARDTKRSRPDSQHSRPAPA